MACFFYLRINFTRPNYLIIITVHWSWGINELAWYFIRILDIFHKFWAARLLSSVIMSLTTEGSIHDPSVGVFGMKSCSIIYTDRVFLCIAIVFFVFCSVISSDDLTSREDLQLWPCYWLLIHQYCCICFEEVVIAPQCTATF
jgi:hypothetical protein